MKLGTSADGRSLTYDADIYEFRLSKQPVSFDDVRALDGRDWIRWRAPELREWFAKIDRDAFIACNRRAAREIRDQSARPQAQPHSQAGRVAQAQPRLRYRSSNPTVASVDAYGCVSVRGNGSADILAARLDDEGFASPIRLITVMSGPDAGVREVRERFKAKGGALAKSKTFRLPELPTGASGYEKVGGSENLAVSPAGKVTVAKGTKRGLHTAEFAVRGTDRSAAGFATVIASVEVK